MLSDEKALEIVHTVDPGAKLLSRTIELHHILNFELSNGAHMAIYAFDDNAEKICRVTLEQLASPATTVTCQNCPLLQMEPDSGYYYCALEYITRWNPEYTQRIADNCGLEALRYSGIEFRPLAYVGGT